MKKKLLFFLFVSTLILKSQAQLVINEISQGPSGTTEEYVEFVVTGINTCDDSCVNLQGWILDDNCGFYGGSGIAGGHIRFNNDPQWQCVAYGTIIVIYNANAPYTGIIADETDTNNDDVYILASNSSYFESDASTPNSGSGISTYSGSSYSAGGILWTGLGMSNGNDAFHTVDPSNLSTGYHSVGWGNTMNTSISFAGSASGMLFQNENTVDNNAFNQANWASQNESSGTPGFGNNTANTAWINSMRTNSTSSSNFDTINQIICDGDSFLFNTNYYSTLGIYTDTLTSASGCDSIVSLNLSLQVCATCQMDLGNDTLICGNINLTLDAGDFDKYLWQDNSTNQTYTATSAGQYWCQATSYDTTNLVINPDFEDGNVNFTTDYNFSSASNQYTCPSGNQIYGIVGCESSYAITTSPSAVHNFFDFCSDHTSSGSGNMMVVNGANIPNQAVWCQTIPVNPNTDYFFSIWATSVENTNATNVSSLYFEINGTQIGTNFSPSFSSCNWQQYSQVWNSGSNTSVDLCIFNHTISGNNDFAIDDIFFGETCTVSDTITISAQTSNIDSSSIDICYGESAQIFGNTETQEGLYLDTLKTTAGCDSLYIKRYLNIGDSLYFNQNINICFDDSAFLENAWQTSSGTYYDTLQSNSSMCDSLIKTNLTIRTAPTVDTISTTCSNNIANVGITIVDTVQNNLACDSIYRYTEVVYVQHDTIELQDTSVCFGSIVNIFGTNQNQAGSYSQTLQNNMGCDSISYIQNLIINPLPLVNAGNDTTINEEENTILQATGANSYNWSTGESSAFVSVSPIETTTYTVWGVDSNQCRNLDSVTVFVIFEDVNIFLPTAFSPNGDGLNDVFRIVNEEDFEEIEIHVYNRWGEMVFQGTKNINFWDGVYKNQAQPIGNYIYFVKATARKNQQKFNISGSVSIVR